MNKWQNFYLQKMGVDDNDTPYPVCESIATWGVWCKSIPFKLMGKVKDPAKRTWNDEHGDDEYIGKDGQYLESYTMDVEFGCKLLSGPKATLYGITVNDVREKVGAFIGYLRESGMMKLYSTYTNIGRQEVRLDSVKDDAKWKNEYEYDGNGEVVATNQWLIFSVTFKVNDPNTEFRLNAARTSIDEVQAG